METVSKTRALALFREAGGARIERYWKRSGSAYDFYEVGVPARIGGWRNIEKRYSSYLTFEGGSNLHPSTAYKIWLNGNRITLEFDWSRIEYSLVRDNLLEEG